VAPIVAPGPAFGTGTGPAFGTGHDRFLAGSHRDTLWEKAYMLVGMEALMMYFLTEPEFVRDVLHHVTDFQLGIAQHYARLGVEFVALGDDLGTQLGPLLGPRIVEAVPGCRVRAPTFPFTASDIR